MATTPESFVDALNSAFGKRTTQRSAHAKGVVLLGTFVPSAEAATSAEAPPSTQPTPGFQDSILNLSCRAGFRRAGTTARYPALGAS
jgi:hypothetical protein